MFGQQPLNKGRQRSLIPLGRLARGLVDLFFVSLNFPAVVEWTGRSYIGRAMVRTIAIWVFGLLASAIIGGFAGAHLSETYDAALFWGALAGMLTSSGGGLTISNQCRSRSSCDFFANTESAQSA
jgi:hypothetical protein